MIFKTIKYIYFEPFVWSKLHALGNSNLAKCTLLVPLVGYFIIFNENLIQYLDLSKEYVWDVGLAVSYKLFFFYFGLTSISLGLMSYQFRCPDIIKQNPGEIDYVNLERSNLPPTFLQYVQKDVKRLFDKLKRCNVPMSAEFLAEVDGLSDNMIQTKNIEAISLLRFYWILSDIDNPRARFFSMCAYAIGFFLLAIPAIDTFIGVCIAFARRLLS